MRGTTIALTLLSLSLPGLAWDDRGRPGSVVDTDLIISNKNIQPDGFLRGTVLAGTKNTGPTFPGPPILATKGRSRTQFRINVVDDLTNTTMLRSTSIHWHGIHQRGTNWADGVAFVTQCPITPESSFQYDFETDQVGTYWYHSHLSTQYCDGLRGALVIYDPEDPYRNEYDVDDENTIITLADWYHLPAPILQEGPPSFSLATLINGKGRAVNGTAVDLSVINVDPGKRYRFRIVGMSCDTSFVFSIDGHDLAIIEADGEYTEKLTVDSIEVFAGQRYSVIMKANKPVANYWIRANSNVLSYPGHDGGRNLAILRYKGAPRQEPQIDPQIPVVPKRPFKEVDLHAKFSPNAPGEPCVGCADVNLNIAHKLDFETLKYTMGGKTYVPPTAPVLLQILSGAQSAQDLLPEGSVYSLPRNKVIELSLPGTGLDEFGPHPFHLHGHSFSVIRSGDSTTYNYKNPVRRDTVNTGFEDGNATIRFVTDNSGPWFLHCHIDWHLEVGLAVVFAEDIPRIRHENPTPESWEKLCPTYNAFPTEKPTQQPPQLSASS